MEKIRNKSPRLEAAGQQRRHPSWGWKTVKVLSVCTISGVVFGIAAEKGQTYIPSVIINQMKMSQFAMMKMFLSAVATSSVMFTLISLPITKKYFTAIQSSYISGLRFQTLTKSLLGGLILGTGMSLCGSCPGMVLVQVGSGIHNAVFTLLGCLTGALLYGFFDSYFPKTKNNDTDQYITSRYRIPFHYIGVPFSIALMGLALMFEHLYPWTTEVPVNTVKHSIIPYMGQRAWNPILAGVILGSMQLPIIFTVGDTLGGSSAYCTVLSQVISATGLISTRAFQYFEKFTRGLGNWWQVFYVCGAILGGYLSASLSGSFGVTAGVSPLLAFTGGICLLFGARVAAGCTSGHGISGMGLFAVHSFFVTPATFAGGIATAFIFLK